MTPDSEILCEISQNLFSWLMARRAYTYIIYYLVMHFSHLHLFQSRRSQIFLSSEHFSGSDAALICNGGPGVSNGQTTAAVASPDPPCCHHAAPPCSRRPNIFHHPVEYSAQTK